MDIPLLIGLLLVGVLALVVLFAAVFKAGRKAVAKSDSARTPGDKVEFVVSTFHEMVEKLKAKEREIEALRSQAEARADRAAALTEDILRSVPSGVLTLDGRGSVTSVNPAGLAILGVGEEEIGDRDWAGLFPGSPPQAPIAGREPSSEAERGEAVFVAPGGEKKMLGYALAPLRDKEQKTIGTIVTFTDLTDIRRLEEAVAFKARLAQLGETAAGIAHELRNPMAVVAGYLDILRKRAGGDETIGPVVGKMETEVKVMDRIITDLLAFARPEPLAPAPVPLDSLLDESMAVVSSRIDTSAVELSRRISSETPPLWGDPDRLRQVFVNLLQNAVEAMEKKGRILVRAERTGRKEVRITVSDSGPGIPADIRDKVFLPFVTRKDGGTGMGLALAQKIVLSHGGQLALGNGDGEGATFVIVLPAAAGGKDRP